MLFQGLVLGLFRFPPHTLYYLNTVNYPSRDPRRFLAMESAKNRRRFELFRRFLRAILRRNRRIMAKYRRKIGESWLKIDEKSTING